MSSTSLTEFSHSIVIVFLWSAAVVLSINLFVESAFSYNLSERTRWHILLLVFALLASIFVQLPGTDLTRASTAGSAEAEDVVKQPSVTPTPICNHQDKDFEILALKSANKLEAAVARERKRTSNAESKTKLAEKKRDDLSYELNTTKENWKQDYLTHVDRLRQLQIANNELVDAEERIRTQVKTVQRSEDLVSVWMRKCWVHQEDALKARGELTRCRTEILDINRKMKKVQREANQKEAVTARVCAKQRSELDRLTANEQKRESGVVEVSPIKAVIDIAPIRPETKTFVDAGTTMDIPPISAAATEPSEEQKTANKIINVSPIETVVDVSPIEAIIDMVPTRPQIFTFVGANTTINMPPIIITDVIESSEESKATENVSPIGPVTASVDISPTPTPSTSETKTLVGAVTTTSISPPTAAATEPTEGSTGSAPIPPTILDRKFKKPVSQLNRAAPVAAAVTRTPHEEVDLLVEMVQRARGKGQTKAALYDIVAQLSYLAGVADMDDVAFIEYALDVFRSIASDDRPEREILPQVVRALAEGACGQMQDILMNKLLAAQPTDSEDDDGDVKMGYSDDDGEEVAGGEEDGGDDNDDQVEMTWPEEYDGLSKLDFELLGEDQ